MPGLRAIAVVVFAVVLSLAIRAQANPLDLKHVSVDAQWLFHVDFDTLRESTIVKKAIQKHQKNANHMAVVERLLGMDPRKDLHGITFYGKEIGKHTGVAILHAKMDQTRLLGFAMIIPGHKVADYGSHKLHSWTHKSRHGSHTLAATLYGDERILFASSVEDLKAAVDVLDGKSASVANDALLAGNIPAGTSVLGRIEGVADAKLAGKHRLAKQTNSFRFVTGEHEGQSFYRARAKMTNPEIVGQLNAVIEGARAMGLIHFSDDEKGKKLINGLRVKAQGATLTVLWSAPANDVWDVIQIQAKVFAEKMAKRARHRGHWSRRGLPKKQAPRKGTPKKKPIPPEEDF